MDMTKGSTHWVISHLLRHLEYYYQEQYEVLGCGEIIQIKETAHERLKHTGSYKEYVESLNGEIEVIPDTNWNDWKNQAPTLSYDDFIAGF